MSKKPAKTPKARRACIPTPGLRICTLDIETAPLEVYAWGLWDQNLGLEMIGKEWSILSYCVKWLDEDEPIYRDVSGQKELRNDRALLADLHKILDEADIVIAQNGVSFDLKKINARLLEHGFKPYKPVRVIDTMVVAKKHFGFTSNKLAWMSQHLTDTKKDKHHEFPGFELWSECLKGNKRAWAEMRKYNVIDVLATEELYLRMRPWIEGHPNVANYTTKDYSCCPKCGSDNVQSRGYARTQSGVYPRYQCQECGGWSRGRKSINTKEVSAVQLTN